MLRPDVVRIGYDIDRDWSGDWAIFFRVLLSDRASKPSRLRNITSRVQERVAERMDVCSLGLIPYFNSRSESEQREIKEKSWA
jgi:hypothetical protein